MKRRDFVKNTGILTAGIALASPSLIFGDTNNFSKGAKMLKTTKGTVKCTGWAAFDTSGELKRWEFERRAVGENDILIKIMAASICHSDIHTELGHWGKQQYPQVSGHEIVGEVIEVGKNVKKFKVGDRAGVGCMVNHPHLHEAGEEEQYSPETIFTYGHPTTDEPTGITQGGYSDYFVVNSHFAVHIPQNLSWEKAAPLMCAGITTYSPIIKYMKKGDKVAIIGIGGLGHMAIKIALSKGADVTAFTSTQDKVKDIQKWGAKAVVVSSGADLAKYKANFDFALSTIPYEYDLAPYVSMVKPFGSYTLVGMPIDFSQKLPTLLLASTKVNINASLIGGMKETQEMVEYCAKNAITPDTQIISADQISQAWKKVINKEARYRFVIDPKTI
ncbi:MAG: NAD(P)-dependent alcohol dehydrogenase [Campylobacter sp.]|nr:NAD(P)-dependent alcohol dehydrogenase [Campylobacter sp.]